MANMIQGKMYRVIYRLTTQRKDRTAVMLYLGDKSTGEHQFSARPLAGTQELRSGDLVRVEQVPDDSPVEINGRKARYER